MKRLWVFGVGGGLILLAVLARSRAAEPKLVREENRSAATIEQDRLPGPKQERASFQPIYVPRSTAGRPAGPQQDPELERRALREDDPRAWRPALWALARKGTPEAYRVLTSAIRDSRNHARASDAVGALARFPRQEAVGAFQGLLRGADSHLTKLRALQGLVFLLRWTPVGSADPEGLAALTQARAILRAEGLSAASAIERESRVAAFRYESKQIRKEIENLGL